MQLTDNVIFITGGGSGIGLGLATAFHGLGNKVIIGGRRRAQLDAAVAAHPGMEAIEIDLADPTSTRDAASDLLMEHPDLNVLINNAGIMLPDDVAAPLDDELMQRHINTNLIGTMRTTSAFIEHLKAQPHASILYNSSTLAFTPLAGFGVYSATKAALHAYVLAQRFLLKSTGVRVQELVPPWVGTGLVGDTDDSRAMPVDAFIEETMTLLATNVEEVVVDAARVNRDNAGPNEHAFINELNDYMSANL